MGYVPNTASDVDAMLAVIGASSISDLFKPIPDDLRNPELELPAPQSEVEIRRTLGALAEKNVSLVRMPSFLGAGIYHHYIPAIVGHLLARGEFQTSYTPYQPEVSQGVLQCAYEFQSMVCQLTGMDVANASMYDAATGLAEAALMAADLTERKRIVVTPGVHPEYRDVIRTYTLGQDLVTIAAQPDEQADGGQLATELLDESIAALLIQHPNFFGCLEDVGTLAAKAHEVGALAVVAVDPIALGLLRSPGACGADIVVADGQSLGNAPSFGGPTAGIFACRQRFLRRLPGRLVGATTDSEENRGYVLTLQTREQHIRRERATSNICTNEALNALAATIYLSTLGAQGLRQIAELCVQKAHYAATAITSLPGFTLRFDRPFFKEFVVRCPVSPSLVNDALLEHGIIGGYDLGRAFPLLADSMLFCVTEMNTRYDIDRMVGILREL